MKITDIKQQVKNQERYSIFVDGKFAFGLSEGALMSSALKIGKELSSHELEDLKKDAQVDKAYSLALGQIARRPRSIWELQDYLKRKDYEIELIEQITERLIKSRWLNDEDFARRWVESRRLLKSTSRRRLNQELKLKRVEDQIISKVLADDQTDEQEVLADLIERKSRQTRYQDPQKLTAYLIRQGYNYQDIKAVLDSIETDTLDDDL